MAKHTARGPAWDAQRLRVLERDGWLCLYCGKALEGADATVDHLTPISLQPDHDYDDTELASSCRSCNSSRGASTVRRTAYYNERWLPNGIAL